LWKICHQIYARKNRHLEISTSYPTIPIDHILVTCDGNASCYNRGRCIWADFWPWSPLGLMQSFFIFLFLVAFSNCSAEEMFYSFFHPLYFVFTPYLFCCCSAEPWYMNILDKTNVLRKYNYTNFNVLLCYPD